MKKRIGKSIWTVVLVSLAFFWFGTPCAAESEPDTAWHFDAGLYFWGASIDGKATTGQGIHADFDDILDDLEFAFMGKFGARKGKWSFLADVMYLDLESTAPVAPGLNATVELSSWVVTPAAGYNLVHTKTVDLDILGGVRYLSMDVDLRVNPLSANASESNWDGIIGARGNIHLTDRWYLPYHFDIGTGEADLTWQAFGGVGYRFKWLDLVVAYRYLNWDFDDDRVIDDLQFSGPLAGIKFRF